MLASRCFSFRFAPRYLLAGLPFGITPWTARVQVDAGELTIRFGYWRLRTPVTNIVGTVVTGPFGFLRTAGPARTRRPVPPAGRFARLLVNDPAERIDGSTSLSW